MIASAISCIIYTCRYL